MSQDDFSCSIACSVVGTIFPLRLCGLIRGSLLHKPATGRTLDQQRQHRHSKRSEKGPPGLMHCDTGRLDARDMTQEELREAIEGHLPRRDPLFTFKDDDLAILAVPRITRGSIVRVMIQELEAEGYVEHPGMEVETVRGGVRYTHMTFIKRRGGAR